MNNLTGALSAAVFVLSTSLTGTSAGADEQARKLLTLTGSSTVAPLAAEIAKRFETEHPGVQVDVQAGGSARGVNDPRQGLADIGMVSRELKPDESDLKRYTIALDGVCIIVNQANPVSALSPEQIVAIYTGNVNNWKEVGGKDSPITVVNKAEGRSTLELFTHYFKLTNSQIKAHIVIGDNQQGIKSVAGNRNAIGYVSVGSAEFEQGQGTPIKLLPLNGVAASVENIRNHTFPLMRPLNLVTKNEPSGLQKQFLDFARSRGVDDLVKEQFFVPVTVQ
jgi:phosphate transport system substrate-binding protein